MSLLDPIRAHMPLRRWVLAAIGIGIIAYCALALNWSWLQTPKYQGMIL